MFYHGLSRCCSKKISIRYPLIEIISAIGAILTFYFFGNSFFQFAISYMLYAICLAILTIDLEHQIIPDELTWLVLLLAIITSPYPLFPSLFAGFFLSLLLLSLHLVTSGRGMGLGDVKLSIALGLWLGLESGLTWLMVSFILGGIVSSVLLILKKANLKTKIAFGPFLIFAFWIVILWKTNAALP
jgi:leader peptidase (prepilin peptidase)/N-methyltransferase